MQLPNFKSMWKKAALAAVTLGGLLCFGGASSAQAHPVVVVRRPVAMSLGIGLLVVGLVLSTPS